MHELSIAEALIDLVRKHAPAGSVVQTVVMEAGPMRGIDNEAMQFAWQSAIPGTLCENARLEVHILPWKMHCPACGREFHSDDVYVACECGHSQPYPAGGDDLRLVALDVETPDEMSCSP